MRNLTTALQAGELRPKERVLLLVQNDIAKGKTGKEILSAADKHALSEGWKPKDNNEVHEYNKYLEGWRLVGAADIDAQTTFLNAQVSHFRKQPLIFALLQYRFNREMRSSLKRMKETKVVDIKEAIEITEMQKAVKLGNGLDFDYAVYKLAFEMLSAEDRARMNELYLDIEFDHAYLDQEEIIANLLGGKGELSKKNKEKLADLVAERCFNKFANEYQLFHYFACIPIAEVARRYLIDKGIALGGKPLAQNQETDDEDSTTHDDIQKAMVEYAEENRITVESMLRDACLKWIDGDLFEQYMPLVLSSDSELFQRWLAAKARAVTTLKKHIAKSELAVRERSPEESRRSKLYSKRLYDAELEQARQSMEAIGMKATQNAKGELDEKAAFATFSDKVITGESLYAFAGAYAFVKEFKEDVDTYNANLGLVYAPDDTEQKGENLDQELLITDTDAKGELSFFSPFGMAAWRLEAFLESGMFFEETEKDGERILTCSNKKIEQVFIETKNDVVEGYATLLSFGEMFEKLSKIYEIDVSYKVRGWIATAEEYIDAHNDALETAAGKMSEKDKKLFLYTEPALKIDPAFYIDKGAIKPIKGRMGVYPEKCEEIFGSEFGQDR